MPITGLTGPVNHPGIFGPGLPINFSDSVGNAGGDFYTVDVRMQNPPANTLVHHESLPFIGPWFLYETTETGSSSPTASPIQGEAATVLVQHIHAGDVVSQGSTTLTYEATAGLGAQALALKSTVPVQGGFTATDRQTLQTVQQQTDALEPATSTILTNTNNQQQQWAQYESVTLPSLQDVLNGITAATTTAFEWGGQLVNATVGQILTSHLPDFLQDRDLSGGITCKRIDYDASLNALYGVTLELTQVPPGIAFRTPDGEFAFPDLAVITIIRGGAVQLRHGVHTVSHTISPLPGLPFPWLTAFSAPLQPGDYHITVDFLEGVCGRLTGQALP